MRAVFYLLCSIVLWPSFLPSGINLSHVATSTASVTDKLITSFFLSSEEESRSKKIPLLPFFSPFLLFPSLPPSTTHIYATTMTNNASGLIFIVLIFLSRETSCFFFFLSSRNDSQAVGALTRSKKRIRLFIIVKITSNVDMQNDKR